MYQTNQQAWDEVTAGIKKSKKLQAICNLLYTDEVRASFRGLTRAQVDKIYEIYTNQNPNNN